MNNCEFKGPFKDIIPLYIKFKQSQGYDYIAGTQELKRLDKYLIENNHTKLSLTEEIVINFCKRRNANESNNTIYKRQHLIKNFAIFLKKYGFNEIYVYNYDFIKSNKNFVPYIFTINEINKIFEYISNSNIEQELNIRDTNFNENFKMIVEIIYCCGLRKSEVLNLKIENIDLVYNTISIIDSKNHTSRLLPISYSLSDNLKRFLDKLPSRTNDYIFKKSNGNLYDKHFVEYFQKVLTKLSILKDDGTIPRLHDLRFTFAVRALEKMEDEGLDVYCYLPLLSEYMGHKNIKSTEYYLKFVESSRQRINDKMSAFNASLFRSDYE